MKWSKSEESELIKNYPGDLSLDSLSKTLGKSVKSVKHKAARLGLSRGKTPKNKPKEKTYRRLVDKEYYEKNKGRIYSNKVQRLKERKQRLLEILGGKCSICGYLKCVKA